MLQAAVKASASVVAVPTASALNGPDDQRHAVASPMEKPEPLIPWRHRDYLQVSFAQLAGYACDAPEDIEEDLQTATRRLEALIPASVRALDGRAVAVEGFMLPTMANKDRVTGFVLLKDQMGCCFGIAPAMNECPCGYLTDPRRRCRCPSTKVAAYLGKLSGPLLDRIDLHIDVPAVPFDALIHAPNGETSAQIRARVLKAQGWRRQRGQKHTNAQLTSKELKTYCEMTSEAVNLLKSAMRELTLSARSYTKILKIARTIADLGEYDMIQPEHVAEAIQYRSLDRQLWV